MLVIPVLNNPVLLAIDIFTLKTIANYQNTMVKLSAAALLVIVNTCKSTQYTYKYIITHNFTDIYRSLIKAQIYSWIRVVSYERHQAAVCARKLWRSQWLHAVHVAEDRNVRVPHRSGRTGRTRDQRQWPRTQAQRQRRPSSVPAPCHWAHPQSQCRWQSCTWHHSGRADHPTANTKKSR